jgi:hypothetical protein
MLQDPGLGRHRWARRAGLAALCGVLAAAPLVAHDLGPFQVFGTFERDGSYRLEVKVDEEHLGAAQLGGPARETRYGRIAGLSGVNEQRFGRFLCDLADSLTLAFDGSPVTPDLAMAADTGALADPAALRRATMLITGWTPGGARTFTLRSALRVRSYPLVLSSEGDELSTWRWVEGGQTSPAFALAPRVVPPPRALIGRRWLARGFAAVVPHGPVVLLLVVSLFLLAGRPAVALLDLGGLALGSALGTLGVLRTLRSALAPAIDAAAGAGAGAAIAPAWHAPRALFQAGAVEPLLALAAAGLALACLVPPHRRRPRIWPGAVLLLVVAAGALVGVGFGREIAVAAAAPGGALSPPLLVAAAVGLSVGAVAAELATLAMAFAVVGLPWSGRSWYRSRVVVPASCLIAIVGLYGSAG